MSPSFGLGFGSAINKGRRTAFSHPGRMPVRGPKDILAVYEVELERSRFARVLGKAHRVYVVSNGTFDKPTMHGER